MFEQFGARPNNNISNGGLKDDVTFRIFIPFSMRDRTDQSQIKSITLTGSFIDQLPGRTVGNNWKILPEFQMLEIPFNKANYATNVNYLDGRLFELVIKDIPAGYYQYSYAVEFNDSELRLVSDPCGRWGANDVLGRSGLVVGWDPSQGSLLSVNSLNGRRKPLGDLIIYELELDDYTREAILKGDRRPPFEIFHADPERLDHISEANFNAIEFMPWAAYPYGSQANEFSWGYDPYNYFAVEERLAADQLNPVNFLVHLKKTINVCHDRGIEVIMDGVFNHIHGKDQFTKDSNNQTRGFAYRWLYKITDDCPFLGTYGDAFDGLVDLNYSEDITQQYIFDACRYWIDEFKIDGIRFDYTKGFAGDLQDQRGVDFLIPELSKYCQSNRIDNFQLILEQLDPNAASLTVTVKGTGYWNKWLHDKSREKLEAPGSSSLQRSVIYEGAPNLLRELNNHQWFLDGKDKSDLSQRWQKHEQLQHLAAVNYLNSHDHYPLAVHLYRGDGRDRDLFYYPLQPWLIALYTSPGAVMMRNGDEFGDGLGYWFPEDEGACKRDNPFNQGICNRVQSRPLRWETRYLKNKGGLYGLIKELGRIRSAYPSLRSPYFVPYHDADGSESGSKKDYVYFRRANADAGNPGEVALICLNFRSFGEGNQGILNASIPVIGKRWTNILDNNRVYQSSGGLLNIQIGSSWGAILIES
jgi:1,4-alpha-glucan branching enzyme